MIMHFNHIPILWSFSKGGGGMWDDPPPPDLIFDSHVEFELWRYDILRSLILFDLSDQVLIGNQCYYFQLRFLEM